MLMLQRSAGNRAIGELLAREHRQEGYEREADRAGDAVLRASPATGPAVDGPGSRSPAPDRASGGEPLDRETRLFFEQRFGHPLGHVRIHRGRRAAESAGALGAEAYTVGRDITLGGGHETGREGRKVLAHELAHVLQQTRSGGKTTPHSIASSLSRAPAGSIQPKLVATGDTVAFAALANSVIAVQQEVVIAKTGEVSLRATNVQGPPTRAAHELVSVLNTIINDKKTTSVKFASGAQNVTVGSYLLSTIDLTDIAAFGSPTGRGLNAGTALAHELHEQYRKQVHSESFPVSHTSALAVEARAAGATITPGNIRQVSATVTEIQDIYTFPDGTKEEVTIELTNGNVTNVTRRKLP
jgi:hypothetical protein